MLEENSNKIICISLITLGEAMVGKTSLISKYINDIFEESTVSTIGFDFKVKTIQKNNKNIKIKIWDTAGQERFNTIQKQYYKNIDGILLLFDLTDINTFNNLNQWFERIEKESPKDCIAVLIGNKCDKKDEIKIDNDKASNFANDEFGIKYFESSAKTGFNLNEIFDYLIDEILKVKEENQINETIIIKTKIHKTTTHNDNIKKCCKL